MGYLVARVDRLGKTRYTAMYRDRRGEPRSAGTFTSRREADRAWQRAEVKLAEGRLSDPRRGRQTFGRYVEETWLPNHVIEPSTRQGYTYQIQKHILPWFGPMRMMDILPSDVREWVTDRLASGVKPKNLLRVRNMLSAIFTTALNDQIVVLHPCKGVKTPTAPTQPLSIITPEQFDQIYEALPTAGIKLMVEAALETGLRWGELTELRRRDIDTTTRIITVSRAVVDLMRRFHPEGGRFYVKDYPKDREWRRLKVSAELARKIEQHLDAAAIGDDDLIFRYEDIRPRHTHVVGSDAVLGVTAPNVAGRSYRHGTLSAYTAGSCRCRHCKNAFAVYRATRRQDGKDAPRGIRRRAGDADGHIPRDWFRNHVWLPATAAAKLKMHVRIHDLRHAHASWLLAGGADLQVVKERLGHAHLATTERYLHTLPDADESAVVAFAAIRHRKTQPEFIQPVLADTGLAMRIAVPSLRRTHRGHRSGRGGGV